MPNALQDQNYVNTDLSITCILGFQSRVMLLAFWTAEKQDFFSLFSPNFRKLLHLLSLMKKFYLHIHFFLHSFSRWVRGMIAAVALELYVFHKLIFFQIKLNFPIHFITSDAPVLFFSFTLDTLYMAGQCKVFQLTLIPLTFWEQLSVLHVHCNYNRKFCEVVTSSPLRLQLACVEYLRCPYVVPKCPV